MVEHATGWIPAIAVNGKGLAITVADLRQRQPNERIGSGSNSRYGRAGIEPERMRMQRICQDQGRSVRGRDDAARNEWEWGERPLGKLGSRESTVASRWRPERPFPAVPARCAIVSPAHGAIRPDPADPLHPYRPSPRRANRRA